MARHPGGSCVVAASRDHRDGAVSPRRRCACRVNLLPLHRACVCASMSRGCHHQAKQRWGRHRRSGGVYGMSPLPGRLPVQGATVQGRPREDGEVRSVPGQARGRRTASLRGLLSPESAGRGPSGRAASTIPGRRTDCHRPAGPFADSPRSGLPPPNSSGRVGGGCRSGGQHLVPTGRTQPAPRRSAQRGPGGTATKTPSASIARPAALP